MSDILFNIDVAVAGSEGSNKRKYLSRIAQYKGNFYSYSLDKFNITMNIGGRELSVNIFDSLSLDKYQHLNDIFFTKKYGFLLIYDISKRETFVKLAKILNFVRQYSNEKTTIMLLGIFFELPEERYVLTEEAYNFARKENILFTEASIATGENVLDSFQIFIQAICRKYYSMDLPDENFIMDYIMVEDKIYEQRLFEESRNKDDDKFFVHEGKNYPFNFYSMKKYSLYFLKRKQEFEECNEILLLNEYDFITSVSPNSIESFIQFTKNPENIEITISNAIEIYSLSIKFQIFELTDTLETYLLRNFNEIMKNFLSNSENLIKKCSYPYEIIISKNILSVVDNNSFFSLPISFLYRVINNCSYKDKSEEKRIEEFIIKIIQYQGRNMYALFINSRIGYDDPEFLRKLLSFSYETTNIGPSIETILKKMKNEIDEIKDKMKIVYSGMTSVSIPAEKTIIQKCLFQGCKSLREINIPPTVEIIDDYAFDGCELIREIKLPNKLLTIGNFSFRGCSSLLKIKIPSTVKNIGNNAFEGCLLLKQISIPSSVKIISQEAFLNCKALKICEIFSDSITIQNDVFQGCTQLKELVVPLNINISKIVNNSNIKVIKRKNISQTE